MAGTVSYVGNQLLRRSDVLPSKRSTVAIKILIRSIFFHSLKPAILWVSPLPSLVIDPVNGTGMIFYIEPVTNVFTLAIDRKGLVVTYIVNKQRPHMRTDKTGTAGDQYIFGLHHFIRFRIYCPYWFFFIGFAKRRKSASLIQPFL